jgi:hypothetical protein
MIHQLKPHWPLLLFAVLAWSLALAGDILVGIFVQQWGWLISLPVVFVGTLVGATWALDRLLK